MSQDPTGAPVTVYVCQGDVEANLIRSFLQNRGIEVSVWGEALRNVHGLTMDGLGRVEIQVRPERVDEAKELLRRMDAGEFEID